MKVKIVKAIGGVWYYHKIGTVYEVIRDDGYCFTVKENGDESFFIDKSDCEIISEPEEVKPVDVMQLQARASLAADQMEVLLKQRDELLAELKMIKEMTLNPAHTMTFSGLECTVDACRKVSSEAIATVEAGE